MSRRALQAGIVGLGCLVACAAAQAPASAPPSSGAGGAEASAASAAPAGGAPPVATASNDVIPAPAAPVAPAAAPSPDDDRSAAAPVFDLGVARAGDARFAFVINVEAFGAHPVGKQLGPVITSMSEWKELSQGADLGIRWILFTSPSLAHAERGTVVAFCTAPDAKIDGWLDGKHSGKTTPFDAGPGAHAVRTEVGGLERVFMRPQPHLLAIVPPESAAQTAGLLRSAHLPAHADPAEAFRVRARDPQRVSSELPASLTEVRFWVAPRKDGGADLFFEGDTPGAGVVSQQLHDFLAKANEPMVRNLTLGLLDHPEMTAEGDVAKVHVRATVTQLAAVLQAVVAKM